MQSAYIKELVARKRRRKSVEYGENSVSWERRVGRLEQGYKKQVKTIRVWKERTNMRLEKYNQICTANQLSFFMLNKYN